MKTIAMMAGLVALVAAGCSDHVQIGSTLVQAVEGTEASTLVDAAPATTIDAASAPPAEAGAFVSFTYAETWTPCDPGCGATFTVNAAGTMICPDGRTVRVAKSDLDAFLSVALRPDVLAALGPGPCSDAIGKARTTQVTLELSDRTLTKDIASCHYEPYDSLVSSADALRSAHCGDAP